MPTSPGRLKLPIWFYVVAAWLALGGFGVFALGLGTDAPRAWGSYLIGFFFSLSLALAGSFFVAAQYLTSAGWCVSVRRIPEAMTAYLVPAAVLVVGVFYGAHELYHWTHDEAVATDLVLQHKHAYLNLPRMVAFMAVGFAVWIGSSAWMNRNSRRQDRTGEAGLTRRNAVLGAVFMVLFALTYSTTSIDLLMSLDPHWFSTIWAIYAFAILMQAGFAFMALATVFLRRTGKLDGFVSDSHVHDLGKLTFAFTVFWAYIAFSQFLLIWYANLPEETTFFLHRYGHGWGYVSVALPIAKFILPFLVLLPYRAKHTPAVLVPVTVWIIAATFLELWWIVTPAVSHGQLELPWMEAAVFAGFLGVFLLSFGISLSRHALVPVKDPRLHEAVEHH
jgi:hypothetical protein